MSNPLPPNGEEPGPSTSHRTKRSEHAAKWINPCRIPSGVPSLPMDMDVGEFSTQSDSEIYSNIVVQVGKAILHAEGFIEKYVSLVFKLQVLDFVSTNIIV
jgi:hypothetical protein